jgi:Zn-dependent alcohol dehydrogenase
VRQIPGHYDGLSVRASRGPGSLDRGLNVIQGLKLAGADMIFGVDVNNDKKDWGERFGMTHFVNPKRSKATSFPISST